MQMTKSQGTMAYVLTIFITLSSFVTTALARELTYISGSFYQSEPFLLRSTTKGDEFSILMPSQPTAFASRLDFSFKSDGQLIDEERIFSSYADGVVFLVKVLKTSNPKKALDDLLQSYTRHNKSTPAKSLSQDFTLGNFKGKQEEGHGKSDPYGESYYSKTQFFTTKRHVYIINATARDESNPVISRFFSSIKLGSMVSDADVSSTPAGAKSAPAGSPAPRPSEVGQVLKPEEVTRKAILVWQPDVSFFEEARDLNFTRGVIKVQMALSASGEVTDVKVLKGLTEGMNQKAIMATKHIRFIPAEKDGRLVSQWHTVDYSFSLY